MNVKLSDIQYRDYKYGSDPNPWERVKIANQIAFDSANDPNIRKLAGQVLRGIRDVPKNGSKRIAQWLRKNFTYLQEQPGVELLQGPYTTMYARVVDCDDAAILHTSLARAAGLRTYFVGIGEKRNPQNLIHAVIYDSGNHQMYEVIDDSNYVNFCNKLNFHLPKGYFALYHSSEPGSEGYYTNMDGSHFEKIKGNEINGALDMYDGIWRNSNPGKDPAPTAGAQSSEQTTPWYTTLMEQLGAIGVAWQTEPEEHYHDHDDDFTTEGYEEYQEPSFPWGVTLLALAGGGVIIYLLSKG